MTYGPQRFQTFDGIFLAYQAWGEGPKVILLHGFMVDSRINWVDAGLIEPLAKEGRRVIALDAHGHHRSDKPHDPCAYAKRAMARDVVALIDALGLTSAVLPQIRPENAARIVTPAHIINRADDVHDAARLAALCPRATAVTVQGDHISTVSEPSFRNALLTFLRTCPG